MSGPVRVPRRLAGEDGMTLVEVLVAAVVLVTGVLGMLTVFTGSAQLNSRSARLAQATDYAQRQIELLRAVPYPSIALSACTGDATWTSFRTANNSNYIRPLATEAAGSGCASGTITPVQTWQDDTLAVRGTVYRYVTQYSTSIKRITVAVTVTGAGGFTNPVSVNALVPDPSVGTSNGAYIVGVGSPCGIIGLTCNR